MTKAFLYKANPAAFKAEIINTRELDLLKEELNAWRRKGLIGKLYNNVVFIRRTPQRREIFLSLNLNADLEMRELLLIINDDEVNITMLIQDNNTR